MKTLLTIICLLFAANTQAQFLNKEYKATLLSKYLLDANNEGVIESQIPNPPLTIEINETYLKFKWTQTKEETALKMKIDDINTSDGEKRYSFHNPSLPGMTYYICFDTKGSGGHGFFKDLNSRLMYYFRFK